MLPNLGLIATDRSLVEDFDRGLVSETVIVYVTMRKLLGRKLTKKLEVSACTGVAKGKYGIYKANVVSALVNMEFMITNLGG